MCLRRTAGQGRSTSFVADWPFFSFGGFERKREQEEETMTEFILTFRERGQSKGHRTCSGRRSVLERKKNIKQVQPVFSRKEGQKQRAEHEPYQFDFSD
jgi:hypothetical protein